jgi:hypothetical protein
MSPNPSQSLMTIICAVFMVLSSVQSFANDFSGLTAYNGETLQVSVVTFEQADSLFEYLSSKKNIPYGLIADGCHARAQQTAELSALKGVTTAKIVIEPKENDKLVFRASYGPWQALWSYHVALVVFIETESGAMPYVIDPALFSSVVPEQMWKDHVLKDTSDEVIAQAQTYYMSRFTFTPNFKDNFYTRLPDKIDRGGGSMLSIFSENLETMGAFYENCIIVNPRTNEETIGGLRKELVPGWQNYQLCVFAGP